jgi:hypothetical protein
MEFDSPLVHLVIKDKILIGTYKKNLIINLEVAQQIVQQRMSFTRGKKLPAMIISHGVTSIDKPAREFLASEKGTEGLSATAIIVNSPFTKSMGNFFLIVNRARIPVKIFSNTSRAEKWLQQFVTD